MRFGRGSVGRSDAGPEYGVSVLPDADWSWPLPMERAQDYMLKAVREAKQQTSVGGE